MFKPIISAFLLISAVTTTAFAQNDSDPNVVVSEGRASKRFFKPNNPENDKKEMVEISAIGSTTFTASNASDGSPNSYKHSQRIIVGLVSPGKQNTFQLVFYSANAEMPYAAGEDAGKTSVYFPIDMYSEIRQKLEQALAARKKVTMIVSVSKNGLREGTLVL